MIAAVLYTVALQFCSGKTMIIKNTDGRQHLSTAQNASGAQTTVGIEYFSVMKMLKSTMCVICTPQAHYLMPKNHQQVHVIP